MQGDGRRRSATVNQMHSPATPLVFGRRRRRPVRLLAVAVVAVTVMASCSSDDDAPTASATDPTLVPDLTALAPGSCDPSEAVDPPLIDIAGTITPATLGLADIGCAGTNGDGYISFNYNPVLLDGDGTVTITVANGVGAVLAWTGATPFGETEPGSWTTTLDPSTCNRVTIQLTSASGASTATYGADIRSGGDSVACPLREVDPSDVPDAPAGTLAPPPEPTDPPRATATTTAADPSTPPSTAPATTRPAPSASASTSTSTPTSTST